MKGSSSTSNSARFVLYSSSRAHLHVRVFWLNFVVSCVLSLSVRLSVSLCLSLLCAKSNFPACRAARAITLLCSLSRRMRASFRRLLPTDRRSTEVAYWSRRLDLRFLCCDTMGFSSVYTCVCDIVFEGVCKCVDSSYSF